MTVVALTSVSGAPGVTTLSCLMAAAWPGAGAVVIEADPSGGVLAARFNLSVRRGWSSLAATVRRGGGVALADHVQRLPGEVPVVVAPASPHEGSVAHDAELERRVVRAGGVAPDGPTDLVVDLGRLWPHRTDPVPTGRTPSGPEPALVQERWLALADHVLLLHGRDVGSVLRIRDRADELIGWSGGAVRLVPTGEGQYQDSEIEAFIGLGVAGALPHGPEAAALACGHPGSVRRLARSRLAAAVRDLVGVLIEDADRGSRVPDPGDGEAGEHRVETHGGTAAPAAPPAGPTSTSDGERATGPARGDGSGDRRPRRMLRRRERKVATG